VETCDIVHRACEVRIADITRMDTSWSLTDKCIDTIMVDQNVTHAKAAKIGREKYGSMLASLEAAWENPYPEMHRGFDEWITEFMWNHLTYDGTPVYPRWKLNGKLLGFELLDPSTIKVLLTNRGSRPLPPAPGFQQILWGFPRGEFVASPEGTDDELSGAKLLYDGGGFGIRPSDQLAYFKRNPRTWSPYGYSVVEECIPAATLYLERQAWLRSEYQEGSLPTGFAATPSDKINEKNAPAFSRIINNLLSGKTGERHNIQWVPQGTEFTFPPQIDEKYKADYDEYIIKRIAAIFGVAPQVLGVVARAGMGGGKGAQEGEAENSELVSQRPMTNFLIDTINSLSRRFLGADDNVTFVFNDMDSGGPGDLISAQAAQIKLFSGQVTLNDIKEAAGRPSYEMAEADEPFILGAGGSPIFLNGLLAKDAAGEVTGQVGKDGTQPNDQDGNDDTEPTDAVQSGGNSDSANGKGQGDTGKDGKQESPGGKQQLSGDGGEAEKTVVSDTDAGEVYNKAAEAQAYKRFLSKARKRDFVFNYHTPDEAEELKAGLAPRPKALLKQASDSQHPVIDKLKAIEEKYGPQIFTALSIGGVAAAIAHALRMGPTDDAEMAKVIADSAAKGNLTFDQVAATKVLQNMYSDAAGVATDYFASQFGPDAVLDSLPSVTDLLNQAAITIKGISDTQMQQISDTIRDGIVSGLGNADITENVTGIIGDETRAQMIAVTETNRGYAEATTDTYQANGISQMDFNIYGDACEECNAIQDGNPYDVDDDDATPPIHPNCRCWTSAVTP
jgi:SPP1 gp7 family putative phage head morphogenesis protein